MCTYLSTRSHHFCHDFIYCLFMVWPVFVWHHILSQPKLPEWPSDAARIPVDLHCFIVKSDLPRLICRVWDQTGEASYLVPETDWRLQECDHHRPDIFLAKWNFPVCPHPQVQTAADVRNTRQKDKTSISLQHCISPSTVKPVSITSSCLSTIFTAYMHSHKYA